MDANARRKATVDTAPSRSDTGMERTVGLPGVFAICTGAMFSSGFFLLPGLAADEAGPSLPLAYLAAGVLVLPALLSLAELSSAMPRAGGPYYFLARGLGPLAGTVGGLGKYAQLLFKGAFAFVGIGAYLSLVTTVPIRPVAIGLVLVFTAVNLVGVGGTTRAEVVLVGLLLVLLSYLVVAGSVELGGTTDGLADRFDPPLPLGIEGMVSAIALVFVSYAGVGQIASISEEVREPSRTIPRGMLLALGTASLFYVVGTTLMVALVPFDELRDDPAPVAALAERFTSLPLPVTLVVVAALAAFASTGNAAILSAARFPLAMARDGLIWHRFARVDDRGVPRTAVVTTGAVLIVAIALFDLEGIAKLASAFLLLVFAAMCLVVIVFRSSRVTEYRPGFTAPLYPWLQLLGIGIYLVLIVESGLQAVALTVSLVVGGTAWYLVAVRDRVGRSGAIYRLLGRWAARGQREPLEHGPWLSQLADHPLHDLVGRATTLQVEAPADLDEVVRAAADVIADRVGGDRRELARHLAEATRPWATPLDGGVAVSPFLLQGIEQPEMVLVRVVDGVEVDGRRIDGVVFVVDDERSSARLLDILSQLTAVMHQRGFARAWARGDDDQALRSALTQDVRSLTIQLEEHHAALTGAPLRDVELPDGSLVALVRRDGVAVVPDGDERLQAGDHVTFLVEPDALADLEQRLS